MRSPFLFLALLGPLPTSAFFPTKFRDNLSMLPGISHEQMTEEVLTSVVSSLFPPVTESLRVALGVPLSQGMLDARTAIVRSNVWVDQWYPNPTWHWEGDDGESARELADMKAALVKHLVEGNINAARINLGQALHLVQDYFAYSDIVMDNDNFERLWRTDLLLLGANANDESPGQDQDNALTRRSRETGGHSHLHKQGEQDNPQNIIAGYSFDSAGSDRHLRAVGWAKAASEAFIKELAQYIPDRQLQHLFGISLDSAVLVDPVAFASPDWHETQTKISAMFDATDNYHGIEKNRAERYSTVNLLSQSSAITYDDWEPLATVNASRSLDILRDTVAGYEIGCRGIHLGTVLSALQQFETGGELVLVVGQEFVSDSETERQIVDFLASNPVAVTVIQLETRCSRQEALTLGRSVADLSGGAYITASDNRQALAFPRDGDLETHVGLGVIQMNSVSNATSPDNIRFLVDGTMDRLLITADWVVAGTPSFDTKLLFAGSVEETFEPISSSTDGVAHRAIWKIDGPAPGEWGFSFGGGVISSFNVTVKGRSSIQLVTASIVESTGVLGHEGYFDILEKILPAETEVGVVGEIYGLSADEHESVEWLVVDAVTGNETKIPMTPGLNPADRPGYADQNTFFGNTTLPVGDFYLVVRGVDALGYRFQRSVPSRMSAAYDPDASYYIGDVSAVTNFPSESEDEPAEETETEAEQTQRIVARQLVTGTGGTTGTPLTPTGPFFPNSTFAGTGASTLGANATTTGANATATPFPTAATSRTPGATSFNTSISSVTIPLPGGGNATASTGATQTARTTVLPPASVPTSGGVTGATESLTTIATILPGGVSNITSGTSPTLTSSPGANATAEGSEVSSPHATVTVIAQCGGPVPPSQTTIASQGAIPGSPSPSSSSSPSLSSSPSPSPSSSSQQGCKACEAQSPTVPIPPSQPPPAPQQSFTEAQGPIQYSPPAVSQETVVIQQTVPIQTPVQPPTTTAQVSVAPAETEGCAACVSQQAPQQPAQQSPQQPPQEPTYGPVNPSFNPAESPALSTVHSTMLGSAGPFTASPSAFTTAASGTDQTGLSHSGHTTSSRSTESTSSEETAAGETASGEGMKGVRAGVVAVMVVAVGGVVFLIL